MSTSIEWTDETWNPLRGCRRISPGCEHCYAERQAARPILSGPGLPYAGLVQFGRQGPRWTGATAGPDQLDVPLRWKKPEPHLLARGLDPIGPASVVLRQKGGLLHVEVVAPEWEDEA